MNVKEISLTALSASLYAVLSVVLAPISFGPVQLRVADCLLPLSALFGLPLVVGVTIGCLVGNIAGGIIAFGMVSPHDAVLGPIANLMAASTIFLFRKRRLTSCILGSVIIGVIVGGYLWLYVPSPDIFGLALPAWAAMMVSITLSSLIAIAVIGYGILSILSRPSNLDALRSMGLKVLD